MSSHSLLRRLTLLLIIHYTVAVPADPNYLTLNSNDNTALSPSLSLSGDDGSTGDLVAPSQGGPVDASTSSDSQWQQGLDSLSSSDDKESSGSLIAGKNNGCQASADQDSLSKRDQNLCPVVDSATKTPTKLQEAAGSGNNAKKTNGTPEQQRRPLPKPQPVDLPEEYQVCAYPGLNVPVCAPESFAIGEPVSYLMACNLPLWTSSGPTCNYFIKYEKLWCCGHAAMKLRNRRPQGNNNPSDLDSAPSTVPTIEQLQELTLNLDKAAPPTLDDNDYPYEAFNCVQQSKLDSFGQPRPL